MMTTIANGSEDLTALDAGRITCTECDYAISLVASDALPRCPACGGSSFRRASLFDRATVAVDAVDAKPEPTAVAGLRSALSEHHAATLAWQEAGNVHSFELAEGWTRIGRSGSADLQFDDPTVSRRHALVVLTENGDIRAMDDRSLNGLFVNGVRSEWAELSDGDELEIGRYRLYLLA